MLPNVSVIADHATATALLELSRVLSADPPEDGCPASLRLCAFNMRRVIEAAITRRS